MDNSKIDYNPFHLAAYASPGEKAADAAAALFRDSHPGSQLPFFASLGQKAVEAAADLIRDGHPALTFDNGKKVKALATLEPGDTDAHEKLYPPDSPLAKLQPKIEAASVCVAAFDSENDAAAAQRSEQNVAVDFSTGVIFDPRGYVIVSRHLKPGLNYYAQLQDGHSFPLKMLFPDDKGDLELAKIENPDRNCRYSILPVGIAAPVENGTPIVAVGFGLPRHQLVDSIGEVARIENVPGDNKEEAPGDNCGSAMQYRLRLNTRYGQSASAVINLKTGNMIGVISSSLSETEPKNYNYYSLMVRPQDLSDFYQKSEAYISSHEK